MPKWRSSFGTVFYVARMAKTTSRYLSQGTYKENKDGILKENRDDKCMMSVVLLLENRLMVLLGKTSPLSSRHLTRDTAVQNIM